MAATRTARAHWEGSLKEGSGTVELVSSGLATFDVSWPARTEEANGKTSPEELIGAAHSTCFSMSVSNELGQSGLTPTTVDTEADVTFQPGKGITGIRLTVRAAVPGATQDQFRAAIEAAEVNCPVSRALTGTEITVESTLVE